MAIAAVICGIAIIVYIGIYDPTAYPAPRCIFKVLTGFDCPGCGSQRAIHAMLNGDFVAAWNYNAAIFFALPLAAVYIVAPRAKISWLYSLKTIAALVAAIVLWWILRNML